MHVQFSLSRLLVIPFLILLALLPTACNEDEQLVDFSTTSLAVTTDQYQEVEQAFAALLTQPKLAQQHIAEQMQFLAASQVDNESFSIIRAIVAHENAPNVTLNTAVTNILEQAVLIISTYGFTTEAGQELEKFYLKSSASIGELGASERVLVEEQLRLMFYLTNSASFQEYSRKAGIQIEEKGNDFACISAIIYLAGLTAACGSGQIYACAGILYVSYLVATYCSVEGGEPVDPCANNPNPCCGVTCSQGYQCNPSNGNCVQIPGYDCDGGCSPFEQCLNGICVPL